MLARRIVSFFISIERRRLIKIEEEEEIKKLSFVLFFIALVFLTTFHRRWTCCWTVESAVAVCVRRSFIMQCRVITVGAKRGVRFEGEGEWGQHEDSQMAQAAAAAAAANSPETEPNLVCWKMLIFISLSVCSCSCPCPLKVRGRVNGTQGRDG